MPMPDATEMTDEQRERLRPLQERLDETVRNLQADMAARRKPQGLLDDDTSRAVALVLAPVLVNMAATGALRRLTRGLAEAGLPVRALDRRTARRIAWPAVALLRVLGGALRPPAELARRARPSGR